MTGEYAGLIFCRTYYGREPLYLALHFAKKKERLWRLPGGKLEKGETPEMAAVREGYEELGVHITKLRKVTETLTEADGGLWKGYWFLVEDFAGRIRIMEPEKHDEARYMTRNYMVQTMGATEPEVEAVDAI